MKLTAIKHVISLSIHKYQDISALNNYHASLDVLTEAKDGDDQSCGEEGLHGDR